MRDLIGVEYDAKDPGNFLEDPEWQGFERLGSVLTLSPSNIEKYLAAAEAILNEAYPAEHRRCARDKSHPSLSAAPSQCCTKNRSTNDIANACVSWTARQGAIRDVAGRHLSLFIAARAAA